MSKKDTEKLSEYLNRTGQTLEEFVEKKAEEEYRKINPFI